jgi:hypothetical protein
MRARAGSLTGHYMSQFAALAVECYIGNTGLLQVERSRHASSLMICAARMRTAEGYFRTGSLKGRGASGVSVCGGRVTLACGVVSLHKGRCIWTN